MVDTADNVHQCRDTDDDCFAHVMQTFSDCKYYSPDDVRMLDNNCFTNSVSCLHMNCRSLPAHLADIQAFLQNVNVCFDIIALSETWLSPTCESLYCSSLPSYNFFSKSRISRQGGGVGVYVLCKYSVHTLQLNLRITSFEFIALVAICEDVHMIILTIYRPPNTDYSTFNNELLLLLESIQPLMSKNSILILAGDFNINLMDNDSSDTVDFLNSCYSNSLLPSIIMPTRITSNTASLIDNIFVNQLQTECCGIIQCDISDHLPIFCVLKPKSKPSSSKQSNVPHYCVTSYSMDKLRNSLLDCSWNSISSLPDVNDAYDKFLSILQNKIIEHVPVKHVQRVTQFRHPWMTAGLLTSCSHKNKLYRQYISGKIPKETYTKYKNYLSMAIKTRKQQYYTEFFIMHKNKSKKIWTMLNSLLGHGSKNNNFSGIIDIESLNLFFAQLGSNSTKHVTPLNDFSKYLSGNYTRSLFLNPATPDEICSIVNNLHNKASVGFDNIPITIIKNVIQAISTPLCHIINLSMTTGAVPNLMKIAKVILIHKSGPTADPANFRPISLLPSLSKILEKAVASRLIKYLEANSILTSSQHGFRHLHNTTTALTHGLDFLYKALDKREFGMGIYLDIAKAFDSVDHNILLNKLSHYGIRGVAQSWFRSYLSNRFQYLSVNNTSSTFAATNLGVPQGSILGPILFLLYINDLPNSSYIANFVLYADDTTVLLKSPCIRLLYEMANSELRKITQWYADNRLALNIKKTLYIVFHQSNANLNEFSLRIDNTDVQRVDNTKFLGLFVDSKLKWKYQIQQLSLKLVRDIAMLKFAAKCVPRNCLKTLYFTFFHSRLTYGITLWSSAGITELRKLAILQKAAIRIICNASFTAHYLPLARQLNILPLNEYITLSTGLFMYKVFIKSVPQCILNLFTRSTSNTLHHSLRQSELNFAVTRYNTSLMHNFIICRGVKLWNLLPGQIKSSRNLIMFKKVFTTHLWSHC